MYKQTLTLVSIFLVATGIATVPQVCPAEISDGTLVAANPTANEFMRKGREQVDAGNYQQAIEFYLKQPLGAKNSRIYSVSPTYTPWSGKIFSRRLTYTT